MVSLGASRYPGRFDPARLEKVNPKIRKNINRRLNVLGPGYLLVYNDPVAFVRGEGSYLYDAEGNEFLDAYNNVPVVGHCHPHVVEAVSRQMATLNTNTRYAQDALVDYAERLIRYFPPELSRVSFACSGSEANDLALRVARHHTGNSGVIVNRWAYHGLTGDVSEISPALGEGSNLGANVRQIDPPNPHVIPAGVSLADHLRDEIRRAIADLRAHGFGTAALILDLSFMSEGIFPEKGEYLQTMIDEVRSAGGIFIADEVQSGFARLGSCMWGFSNQGVIPDIVTMGKPMGNGIPISGAVFRPEVAQSFGETVRYFNTFGGSSVPIAAGNAVLDVFEAEGIPERVDEVGRALRAGINDIVQSSSRVLTTRGAGMAIGVEVVSEDATRRPDRDRASSIINSLRDRRILISGAGPHSNVLKIRPPLSFSMREVDRFLTGFSDVARKFLL